MIALLGPATRRRIRKAGSHCFGSSMPLFILLAVQSLNFVPVSYAKTLAQDGKLPTGRLINLLDDAMQQPPPTPTAAPPLVQTPEISAAIAKTEATTDSAALNDAVNAVTDAREAAIQAKHLDEVAAYEARKKADQEAYAAQVAAYEAEVKRVEAKRITETAAWQARVKACKAGDISQCGK